MVRVPVGGVTVIAVSGVVQFPAARVPLALMPMGQAKTRKVSGATDVKTACHVPTIMDWAQAGNFTTGLAVSGCWAEAADTSRPERTDANDARTIILPPKRDEPGYIAMTARESAVC
jgi:hypothetical protein